MVDLPLSPEPVAVSPVSHLAVVFTAQLTQQQDLAFPP